MSEPDVHPFEQTLRAIAASGAGDALHQEAETNTTAAANTEQLLPILDEAVRVDGGGDVRRLRRALAEVARAHRRHTRSSHELATAQQRAAELAEQLLAEEHDSR